MLYLLTVLVFFSVLGVFLGVYAAVRGRRATIENRLRRAVLNPIRREGAEAAFVAGVDRKRRRRRETKGWERHVVRLEERLLKAGVLLRAREFVMLAGAIVAMSAAVVLLLTGSFTNLLLVSALGLVLPNVYLNMRVRARRRLLSEQVADMILLMANGLKAGHSLIQVMESVSREVAPPLSEHLKTFLRDTVMGMSVEDALVKMEQQADDEDLSLVITAVLIQYQVGGNLAEILNNISFTIRERVRLKKEIQALTAQGRLSAIIISLLPVSLAGVLTLISPDFLSVLFQEPMGWAMVGTAVVLQLIGIFVFRRVVSIKV